MVGIRELRSDLAAVVRRAGAGQRVVVSVGGRPVAELGPVGVDRGDGVQPPRRTDPPRLGDPVPVWPGLRLDRVLREVR